MFANPDKLLDALVADGWVDPHHPRDSQFFTKLLSFHGPMYKAFTPTEQDTLLDWVESVAENARDPGTGPVSSTEQVRRTLDALEAKAAGGRASTRRRESSASDSSSKHRVIVDATGRSGRVARARGARRRSTSSLVAMHGTGRTDGLPRGSAAVQSADDGWWFAANERGRADVMYWAPGTG